MTNPWDRNEGKFDKPSSSPTGAPIDQAAERKAKFRTGLTGKRADRVIIDDPLPSLDMLDPETVARVRLLRAGIGQALSELEANLPKARRGTFTVKVRQR
jgi:hypothetical protein